MRAARRAGERPRTRADALQAEIADAIVRGRFLPGARLDEQSLADAFGTSRTPVREALRQLTMTGLVEMRPHRGAVVRTITPDDLSHLFETMAELEAGCAHYAALRMLEAQRAALKALHESAESLAAARDPERYAAYNLDFHGTIYEGTANPTLPKQPCRFAPGLRRFAAPSSASRIAPSARRPSMGVWSRRSSPATRRVPRPACVITSSRSATRRSATSVSRTASSEGGTRRGSKCLSLNLHAILYANCLLELHSMLPHPARRATAAGLA
jgi:DNA-binding GntR family transcriptional regulator